MSMVDGDMDILATWAGTRPSWQNMTVWFENLDGHGEFGAQRMITHRATRPQSLFAADLDNDGDIDLLTASEGRPDNWDSKIAWYENVDGRGTFGDQRTITSKILGPKFVSAGDVDGDGYLDVLSASLWDNKVAWYRADEK